MYSPFISVDKYGNNCNIITYSKRPLEYEQLVVTPVHADISLEQERLNDDNEDFASRRRYHQSTALQSHLVNVDS